jgi:hypothetical protein
MVDGRLNIKQKIVKSSKIKKLKKNYKACISYYSCTESAGWKLINIGPFENECIVYTELNKVKDNLKKIGYIDYNKEHHIAIAVLEHHRNECE